MNRFFWKFFIAFIITMLFESLAASAIVVSYTKGTFLLSAETVRFFMPGPPTAPGQPPPAFPWVHLFAFIVVSLAVSALLAWNLTKPIGYFRRAFDTLAKGDLSARVLPLLGNRKDEIGNLGQGFDHMAEELQVSIESQRRLIHDISHELRSPLARLHMAIGLFQQEVPAGSKTLLRLEKEIGRIDGLVGQMLSLARMESGISSMTLRPCELPLLLHEIKDDAELEARSSNKQITLDCPAQATVQGSKELIWRAFENIIRNALRYTKIGTTVAITLDLDDTETHWRLRVRDHGPGVSEEEVVHLCSPFFRASSDKASTGHGLGLSIAKRAIQAHGGRLVFENVVSANTADQAEGLVVSVLLPRSVA